MSARQFLPPDLRGHLFNSAALCDAGLSPRATRSASIRRVRWSVYVDASVPESLALACDAAAMVLPTEAAFSHHTAAALYGLPVPACANLHVMVPVGLTVPKAIGIIGHEGLNSDEVTIETGRRLVAPERLFVDLAAVLDSTALIVLGDAMLNTGLTNLEGLRGYVSSARGRRWITRARSAVEQLDPRSESAMESVLRIHLVRAGLPRPVANYVVRDADGGWLARVDLAYPAAKIAIEYDGDQHRTEQRQWRRDIRRAEVLRAHGWIVIRLTADDVFEHGPSTIERVRQALAERAYGPSRPRD